MDENKENALLPTDVEGRETLTEKIEEGVVLLREIDDLQSSIKDIAEIAEDSNLTSKKNYMRLVKAAYKADAETKLREATEVKDALSILYAN